MIHRYRINKNRLLGPNNLAVSAVTTTWISGSTTVSNTVEFDQGLEGKHIVIPIQLKFDPMDYSDLINSWVDEETRKVINRIFDSEKVKYINPNGLTVTFRFMDSTNDLYVNDYYAAGFLPEDFHLNRFKKSFFRLYFYDENDSENSNLLFTEDFNVEGTEIPTIPLERIFWDREDELMENSLVSRTVWMEARFFNAKNGKVHTFFNPPTTVTSMITVGEYSDTSNRGWRRSPIVIVNPNTQNGNYRFYPIPAIGGNTVNNITMSEFILL